jgi:hypothetical protein
MSERELLLVPGLTMVEAEMLGALAQEQEIINAHLYTAEHVG